ncbi:MAG: F0F1 ATP synthase subunit delta [Cytophagales bacterium]|nr:F0F1 ATP synthase subunit delta [Cytophagales bacterium]
MAEIATIARPYAEALFQASKSDLGGTQNWLNSFAAVAADASLLQFAANPKATDAQVVDLVLSVSKVQTNSAAVNFLTTVVENGRLNVLGEIAAQFQKLKNAAQGVNDAIIYSAFPIEGAALIDLVALLEKRFGRKLNASVQIDASLIGGVRVVVGDEVLDTSVRARLDQMKAALVA